MLCFFADVERRRAQRSDGCCGFAKTICWRVEKKEGKGHLVEGRGEVQAGFLREDLVDGLYLGVVPVLIGEGIPAFPSGFPQRKFALTENETFSQGLIALKYERVRMKKK